MPITSHQVGSMIGGQQAMFGNFASYAQQISPGFQGQPPTYANPMAGAESGFAPPPPPMYYPETSNMPIRAMSAIGNIGLPLASSAAMVGGTLAGGRLGSAIGGLDPFSMGLKGFARGSGLSGGAGILSNMSNIASGGVGSIGRAALAGVGGAMASALPMYAAGQALSWGVGQAVEGAQYGNQVQGFLDQNFRFQNRQAQSGHGFSRRQGMQIADMARTMGHSELMTGPQELLRVMQGGAQMGLFRAVQDVKEFKKRFTDMVGTLKEVAKTMNTTLEGAMPFFGQARQMGFWTPTDITRHAAQAHTTAGATGMSVAQTQQMMAQGAQMARSVGAQGTAGAQGMAQTLGLVGSGLRGGVISERALSEATGGLSGPEAIQSFAGTLQAGATRFARSTRARWVMAALGRNNFTSLDPGKMQDMMSGTLGLGAISGGARRNIRKQGAFNFVQNEEELRGELIKQGPMAQLGFIRSMIGGQIYGDDARSKYITRRLIKRGFGVDSKQADLMANLAKRAPEIQAMTSSRSAAGLDQKAREQELILNRSYEGFRRKAGTWFDKNVKDTVQKYGDSVKNDIADYFERAGNRMWGATASRHRFSGISGTAMNALQRGAMGDTRIMEETFGKPGQFGASFGGGMGDTGFFSGTNDQMELFKKMGAKERLFTSEAARDQLIKGGGYYSGSKTTGGGRSLWGAFDKGEIDEFRAGLTAAASGQVGTKEQAGALGFGSMGAAKTAMASAQKEMDETYRNQAAALQRKHQAKGRELAEIQVRAVLDKKLGSAALRKYVSGGKDMNQMVNRLVAAQSGEQRGEWGGVDFSEDAETAGLDALSSFEKQEKIIGGKIEAAEAGLSGAIGSENAIFNLGDEGGFTEHFFGTKMRDKLLRGGEIAATPKVLENITTKGGEQFKRAMMLMSSGGNDAEKAENRGKAKEILNRMARDKKYTPTEAATIAAMADDKHPKAREIKENMKQLGNAFKQKERAEFAETVRRRSQRFFEDLGKNKDKTIESLNRVKGSGKGLGDLVASLQGETSPEAYKEKLREITKLAGEADATEVASAAEQIGEVAGGEVIVAALTGGRQVGDLTKALTGPKTRRGNADATSAANAIMTGLVGDDITTKEMKALRGGDAAKSDEVIKSITGRAPKENQDITKSLLEAMRSGNIGSKLLDKKVTDALGQLSPENMLVDRAKDMTKSIDRIGALGSQKGMHSELIRQSTLLQDISRGVGRTGKKWTENPKDEATD